uniref:Uncharacterized protein n=1 Tax=Rhizophora mucronata TaxID=61149 RepID=A0A2P2QPL7_RHIMU
MSSLGARGVVTANANYSHQGCEYQQRVQLVDGQEEGG